MKKFALFIAAACAFSTLGARITDLGTSPVYGISEDPQNWYEINAHTWEVFASMEGGKMLGIDADHYTTIAAECYSTGVIEGRKVGDFTAVGSFKDRGEFFGGDGYFELVYFAPTNMDKYAQQIDVFGGWKYNLTKYVDIDLGGNVIYSTKRVLGPGLVIEGMGGETLRGDIYVCLSSRKVYVSPFALVGYDPTYDEMKVIGGFTPSLDLSEITAIKGLSIQTSFIAGYMRAQRFSGSEISTGGYWRCSYSYIQTEANLVYVYKGFKTFVGVGWAIHDGGRVAPNGVYMGSDNNVWAGGGIGWIF